MQIAKNGLNQMMKDLNADLLSCYFLNRYSGLYWLFHKSGTFYYPEQMTGPLTHSEQLRRMGDEKSPNFLCNHFEAPEDNEISRDILNGQSFVRREEIHHSFRFRLEATGECWIVIFLNYRGPCQTDEIIKNYLNQRHTLKEALFTLLEQPFLNEKDAWRLRSMSLIKQKAFSDMLTSFEAWEGSTAGGGLKTPHLAVAKHWELIVRQAQGLLHPDDKNCLTCQLYAVNRDGGLTLLAGRDDFKNERDPGVCNYVAKTAQIFSIDNIPKYEQGLRNRGGPDDSKLPAFVACVGDAMSEIACPLVVQGKVVGVLNLESGTQARYGDREALLLFLYATSVALSLRQVVLFTDLKVTTTLQHKLLSLNNEEEILGMVVKAVNDLGYVAGIWAFDEAASMKGNWVPGSNKAADSVRLAGGHTFWIRNRGQPVAIADYKPKEIYDAGKKRIAELDSAKLFKCWYTGEKDPDFLLIAPNEKIASIMEDHHIATDFGFPIFSESSGGQIIAVLWAKCFRHFVSVLDEEVWFLSLICRSAAEACRVARERFPRLQAIKLMEQKLYEYHFGEARTRALLARGNSIKDWSFKKADDLIVLQIDIRGSSKFASECFACKQGNVFHEVMAEYHSAAQLRIQSQGGIYDKSVGDAVIGIFHAYRPDLLPFGAPVAKEDSMRGALEAFKLIVNDFEMLLKLRQDNLVAPLPFRITMRLGCIVEIGAGYIGSTSKTLPALDFTVYGMVANRAGKLTDLARWENLMSALKNNEVLKLDGEGLRELSSTERTVLGSFIDSQMGSRSPVLLLHVAFLDIRQDLIKRFTAYKVSLGDYSVLWVH
jgi:class 3 adenylate cyclase/GAF domain-containing protein